MTLSYFVPRSILTSTELNVLVDAINSTIPASSASTFASASSLADFESALTTLESTVTSLGTSITADEASISTINTAITSINATLTGIETNVTNNSNNITTLTNDITTINTAITNAQNAIDVLSTLQATQGGQIVTLNTDISNINTEITALNSSVATAVSQSTSALLATTSNKVYTPRSALSSFTQVNMPTTANLIDGGTTGSLYVDICFNEWTSGPQASLLVDTSLGTLTGTEWSIQGHFSPNNFMKVDTSNACGIVATDASGAFLGVFSDGFNVRVEEWSSPTVRNTAAYYGVQFNVANVSNTGIFVRIRLSNPTSGNELIIDYSLDGKRWTQIENNGRGDSGLGAIVGAGFAIYGTAGWGGGNLDSLTINPASVPTGYTTATLT